MSTKVYVEKNPEFFALQWTGDNIDEWQAEFDYPETNAFNTTLDVSIWHPNKRKYKQYIIPVSYYLVRKSGSNKIKILSEETFAAKYEERVA